MFFWPRKTPGRVSVSKSDNEPSCRWAKARTCRWAKRMSSRTVSGVAAAALADFVLAQAERRGSVVVEPLTVLPHGFVSPAAYVVDNCGDRFRHALHPDPAQGRAVLHDEAELIASPRISAARSRRRAVWSTAGPTAAGDAVRCGSCPMGAAGGRRSG